MADEVEKYRIPLFDGSNFSNWKFRIQTLLEEMDLFHFAENAYTSMVETSETDTKEQKAEKERQLVQLRKRDQKCKSQIVQRMADSHLEYAKDKKTAHELWKSLCTVFERKGIISQLLIRKTLLTMKFNPTNDTLASHFLKFDKCIRELRSTGATLEENDIVCHLLLTMPVEFDAVVTAIETLSGADLSISFVKNRLLDEESKRRDLGLKKTRSEIPSTTAFSSATRTGNNSRSNKYRKPQPFPYQCHQCGMFGHRRADCRRKPHGNRGSRNGGSNGAHIATNQNGSRSGKQDFCFPATTKCESGKEIKYFLDSGATEHLASKSVSLFNVRKLTEPVRINVAKSGTFLEAKEIGDLEVDSTVNGKEISIKIKNVLSVPGLQYNLLSVRKLEMNGYKIIFNNGKGIIKSGNRIVAVAFRSESQLYALCFRQKLISANLCTSIEDLDLWHRRLGHLNYESVRKLQGKVEGMNVNPAQACMEICDTCIEGKQTRQPHDRHRPRTTRPLQRIHSDLFGPVTPTSYDGKRYVLTLIDDFTHFTAAYTLESKSEVFRCLKSYEAVVSTHFNLKISCFRCDNGREYISKEIKNFFEEKGIKFEFTIRYTPQQNGVAERMNRTIIERARCMILNSTFGKEFWSEAVLTAVYLINRSPTSALDGKVPASLWFNETTNISKLKVFGCIAYLRIPNEIQTGKFESRSKKCFMIGYCTNGYKLWCPEQRKIIFGKDVVFNERRFSFEGLTSEQWNNNEETKDTEQIGEENLQEKSNSIEKDKDEQEDMEESNNSEDLNFGEPNCMETPRRSGRATIKPRYLYDYAILALNAESFVDNVPESYEEVETREDKQEWTRAIQEEIDSLVENDTWELTTLPLGKRLIDNKWIFKIKRDGNGNVERYKARLVIRGCAQRKGYDYEETYAPVARLTTLRTLLSVINEKDLLAYQMDVKNAFLHGKLKEEIYMKPPLGFKCNKHEVCKLRKALYGLKQAPRAWNETFDRFVKRLEFKQAESDKCLYISKDKSVTTYMLLYVDDIIIAGNSELRIEKVKSALKEEFRMKDLGELRSFLGINILRSDGQITLSQPIYLRKLLIRFNMEECNPAQTPMEAKPQIHDEPEIYDESKPDRELIGCLMFVMVTTRPDLSAAVNYFSRYQNRQTEILWKGLKRILRYIKGTLNLSLCFRKGEQETVLCYADADYGSETDRKSTSGYLVKVYGNTVLWATRRQTTVALSSTEAEYVALAIAASELLWLKNLLDDLGISYSMPLRIFEDNQSCIHLMHKWEHRRLKHIDVKYNFIRDLSEKGLIEVRYLNTKDQIADILTKALPCDQYVKLRLRLGLRVVDGPVMLN